MVKRMNSPKGKVMVTVIEIGIYSDGDFAMQTKMNPAISKHVKNVVDEMLLRIKLALSESTQQKPSVPIVIDKG